MSTKTRPITRDDLLGRIPERSPYEAVIVAAREARRLNRIRIAQRSLLAPPSVLPAMLSAGGPTTEGGENGEAEESDAPVRPVPQEGAPSSIFPTVPRPEDRDREEKKVTIEALERLAEGKVEYAISDSPVEPEED